MKNFTDVKSLLKEYNLDLDVPDPSITEIEYESVFIPEFSEDYQTNIVMQNPWGDDGAVYLRICFCLDTEGIIENIPILIADIDSNSKGSSMFIARFIKETYLPELDLEVVPEMEAYKISDFNEFYMLIDSIFSRITNKQPSVFRE